ncbi:hypothetical protein [Chishuiella sp.]|uniref:hypothetical protein n=1 Tax=Chishuiella sp. TaxID=1969467 RepID=UPI0028ACC137|nr:hypothetical protein [Chishuiella sp.]
MIFLFEFLVGLAFIKGKDEYEVRNELSTLGWDKEQNQNEVFEAIDGIQGQNQMNKTN